MKVERMKEGWVSFQRYHCKEGHIDCWTGDSINHPDNEHKSLFQLNSFSTYWRCNGRDWVKFKDSNVHIYLETREEFTAEEIWDQIIKTKHEQYAHECKVCGQLFDNEDDLYEHHDDEHN